MSGTKSKHRREKDVHELTPALEPFKAQLFEYNSEQLVEKDSFEKIGFENFNDDKVVSWLNLHGITNPKPVELICSNLGIHDLVLEDILDTNQRPKLQEFDNYLQFSIKLVVPENDSALRVEQISFILGKNYLLSFQEREASYFNDIRLRIRQKKGIVRERTADYLLFLLLDAVLDSYFQSVEKTEEKIDRFVKFDAASDPRPDMIFLVEKLKSDVLLLKKLVEPIKTAVLNIENDQDFIRNAHLKYYTELKDQCNQLLDEINTLYQRLDSANNLFFSLQGYKMNQVMKTLTVMSTIFIPLTFIVGVYGMNFDVMPELRLKWGYFAVWGVMLSAIVLMMIYFKRKKWF